MSVRQGGMPPLKKPVSDGIEKPKSIKEVPSYLLAKCRAFISRLAYIISLVWGASPAILIAMSALCLVDGFLPVIGAYITRDILNGIAELISGGSLAEGELYDSLFVVMGPVVFLFALEMVYLFFKRVLSRLNTYVTAVAGELVVNHIKLRLIGKAKDIDQSSYDNTEFYEKLENANREAGIRPIQILSAAFKVISGVISVASFIVVLATLTPLAPIIVIAASIPGAIVNYYFRNTNFRYIRRNSKERRRMNYYSSILTDKDRAKEIRILGLNDTFTEKYKTAFSGYYRGLKRIMKRECITQILVGLVYVLASGALFVFVAYSVVFKSGLIGDYSLYSGALNSITSYVSTIVTSTATIYEGTLFIENVIDFMQEKKTVVPTLDPPREPQRHVPHTIEFKNVSFRYPGMKTDVIKNVNLTLKTDETVILVGLNGAGKSTLLKLIMRLYDPTDGQILLDGKDIREYDTEKLYSMYGIIFQDFGRYADTVAENIRFGDVLAENDGGRVSSAAEAANASGFIGELSDGYDTPLTRMFEENGIELSGGQWQKLSVARAFYKDSDILIMDEPTASLDPLAEQEVFNSFTELSRGKISVFVSHRLSGATTAGKIIVLDGGEIKETGTHSELMSKRGLYHELFTTQARRYYENL